MEAARRRFADEEDNKGDGYKKAVGGGQSLLYGPYVILFVVFMLLAILYVSFNFRMVSRNQEADHALEIQSYIKIANDARKELARWKQGITEKDLTIRDLEYKLATAKKSRDEYMEALKIKDQQLSRLAAHPNPRG
mmetsp:Transcript_35042/g.99326  ORF Transcript_35042/g.99326 Transcript_35042/m.99326 type:complete len:136 (-) Transcript_35042:296-703(-)|eukprot:CAMPEP_0117674032 /NCGR_PEP_ID=MMETSP0804-20121206/14808_1 /TAXON_ID=1074897 /ORGANISM="Tetraselmis astigmatica, Strain CCMP880" /LENGTH=135 /DNA_ID=CAMNT_0005482847 /DNA_START=49 /DNA_END=456 /DNA_ORIENTATION=-